MFLALVMAHSQPWIVTAICDNWGVGSRSLSHHLRFSYLSCLETVLTNPPHDDLTKGFPVVEHFKIIPSQLGFFGSVVTLCQLNSF